METRPIFSAILRNKLGPILVAAQIAVTLAVLVNGIFIAHERIDLINRPTGMDVENIFQIASVGFGLDYNEQEVTRRDLETIRAMEGVIAVTPSNHTPLSGGGWGETFTAEAGRDAASTGGNIYAVDEQGVEALGLRLAAGRSYRADEIMWPEGRLTEPVTQAIISSGLAEDVFGDEPALGKTIYLNRTDPATVIGVIEHMHGAWINWDNLDNTALIPAVQSTGRQRYLIRTEPGQRDRLMAEVETTLAKSGDQRIIRSLASMSELKRGSYEGHMATAFMLLLVSVLLIVITGLGIVGLVSFLVNQRTKQVGTRRALGAQRFHVVRYFLVENWLITSIGLTVGLALAVALNMWMVHSFEMPKLDLWLLPIGIVAIWILGLSAAFGPARRAANIPPAMATRTV